MSRVTKKVGGAVRVETREAHDIPASDRPTLPAKAVTIPLPGPGRNKGVTNVKSATLERTTMALYVPSPEAELLPHEFLRKVAQGHPIQQSRFEVRFDADGRIVERELITEQVYPPMSIRVDAAKVAARYFAPTLSSTTLNGDGDGGAMVSALKQIADRLPV